MLASLVKGLCSNPHSPGRKPYLSRVKRVTPGISLGGVRREVSKEALGTRLEAAAPPLVEPELGAAQSRADRLDRAAAESESDGALVGGEFVAHGYLRGAA